MQKLGLCLKREVSLIVVIRFRFEMEFEHRVWLFHFYCHTNDLTEPFEGFLLAWEINKTTSETEYWAV